MITKEEFDEWKENPTTKQIFKELERMRANLLANLSKGTTLGQSADVTHGMTSKAVGQIEGLNQIINITFEEE